MKSSKEIIYYAIKVPNKWKVPSSDSSSKESTKEEWKYQVMKVPRYDQYWSEERGGA